jgi:hypothetical protein
MHQRRGGLGILHRGKRRDPGRHGRPTLRGTERETHFVPHIQANRQLQEARQHEGGRRVQPGPGGGGVLRRRRIRRYGATLFFSPSLRPPYSEAASCACASLTALACLFFPPLRALPSFFPSHPDPCILSPLPSPALSLPLAGSPARAYPYSGEGVAGTAEAMPVNRLLGGVPGHMRAGQSQALAQVRLQPPQPHTYNTHITHLSCPLDTN